MILEQATFDKYHYLSTDLRRSSHKRLIISCDSCQKTFERSNQSYYTNKFKDLCRKCCALKTKETNLLRYGVENPSQNKEIRNKSKATCLARYGTTTPLKCESIKQRIKDTNLLKYGVDNPLKNENVRQKIKTVLMKKYNTIYVSQNAGIKKKVVETNLLKYGVDNPFKSNAIKQKIKDTNLSKYGVDNPFKSEIVKQKIKDTNLLKYGVENPCQNKDILQKVRDTNLSRYGYEYTLQNKDVHEKAKITLLAKYGVDNFSKFKELKYDGKTIREWALEKHTAYSTACTCIKQFGIENFKNKEVSLYTDIEQVIADFFIEKNINFVHNKYIEKSNKYRPDFFIPSHKLVIECDGIYWHSDSEQKDNQYHVNKKRYYDANDVVSLFFREDEILSKPNIVKSIISNKLGINNIRIFARKTNVKEVAKDEAELFLGSNHLMGNGQGASYALFYENNLVSTIQVKWKNKQNKELEISRFCNKMNTSVVGGFSKLLKHVCNVYSPNKIINFVDLRYGNGNNLLQFGFKQITEYPSFKWTNFINCYSRMTYRGNTGYDYGLAKIWDCGQRKFELIVS